MHGRSVPRARIALFLAVSTASVGYARADVDDPFPASRPANRLQALAALGGGIHAPESCMTLRVEAVRSQFESAPPSARRAMGSLRFQAALPAERRVGDAHGDLIRYTLDPSSIDRLPGPSRSGELPSAVRQAQEALTEARALFQGRLDFPEPGPVELVLAHLGPGVSGLFLPAEASGRTGTLWIDPASGSDPGQVRSAVIHQFAHAVASRIGLEPAWAEALAGWAALQAGTDEATDVEHAASERLLRLTEGIPTEDARLALGNAVWLSWLQDAKGANALRIAMEEMSSGPRFATAMDRALRRVDGSGFGTGLRDFHLWSVLVGRRDDGRHFPFASRLSDPAFQTEIDGVPALSIHGSPPVAPGGASHSLVRPGLTAGGVTFRFEGDFGGAWECDLLLRGIAGGLHRLAVPLDEEGRGEVTVPAQAAEEAIVLVRNLQEDGSAPRRYTWTAFREPGHPVEFVSLGVSPVREPRGVVSVRWETSSERGLVGFHVIRSREPGGEFRRLHAVWVPAVGTPTEGALYEFLDTETEPGASYVYRVVAITEHGLEEASRPVTSAAPSAAAR